MMQDLQPKGSAISSLNRPYDLIRMMRPEQWLKNLFVFTGLFFGDNYSGYSLFIQVLMTAISFCFISSCIYVVNDIFDREKDLLHPKKKDRPLPAGKVTVPCAWGLSVVLGVIGLLLGTSVSYQVAVILLTYVVLNFLYSYRLKKIEIVDVFCISLGFMLRILAGTIGVGIPPSNWLLMCGMMITLFLGFAKRFAEINILEKSKGEHRKVLEKYQQGFLENLITICATGTIITYSLYTMSSQTMEIHNTQNLIYTVPFVIFALFRYIFLLYHKEFGGEPTKDLLRDPAIIIAVLGWGIATGYVIYGGW